MPFHTRQAHLTPQQWAFYGVTIGTVVDTNDPQQMGRVRALCLALNDIEDAIITDIPWSSYASPFGGTVQAGTRGVDDDEITGPTAYGMWAIPKIGSQVLVMCLDGNPQTRIWVGCLHTQLATHTMPHGRFSYKTDTNLPDDEKPAGPVSTFENIIEPLHTNLRAAFDSSTNEDFSGKENFEFQSRGADFQVSGMGLGQIDSTFSQVEDDQDEDTTGSLSKTNPATKSRQGYQTSRIAPDQFVQEGLGPRNLDNTVTSIVSPGFHALSMDDRGENCRIRVRTTGGHQIIFDDTNERIYLSTAAGENWIEMDQQGNIDIYTSGKISAHAAHDINFTSDRSIRMYGKAGVHIKSDQEVRITAKNDISLNTKGVLRALADGDMLFESVKDIHLKATVDILATAQANVNIKANSTLKLEGSTSNLKSSGVINIEAGGAANIDGSKVNLAGGGSAASADEAEDSGAGEFLAFFTNRIPDHEPWARVDTRADDTVDPQHDYAGDKVGKQRRITATGGAGEETPDITRGSKWRR